jgi:signal transduction histidine kinase
VQARLRELAETTSLRARVDCSFQLEGRIELRSGQDAVHLYRIAQEAIQNALRHGEAKSIQIRLAQCDGGCVLHISDSGHGFSLDNVSSTGIGLQIMRHRAEQVNGRLEIQNLGPGTRVSVFIPQPDETNRNLEQRS